MDLDCGSFLQQHTLAAQQKYPNIEQNVNNSLKHLFSVRMRLGEFDPIEKNPLLSIPISVINSQEHQDLALQAAEEGIVLLKNKGVLPLANEQTFSVIGPNADDGPTMQGN